MNPTPTPTDTATPSPTATATPVPTVTVTSAPTTMLLDAVQFNGITVGLVLLLLLLAGVFAAQIRRA